jgi:mannose-6-phosphate isomerase-like protein (cupin superfamily)
MAQWRMPPVSDPSDRRHGDLPTFHERPSMGRAVLLVGGRPAPGAGAPPNRPPSDDGAFHILSGRQAFSMDGTERLRSPGDHIRIPNGASHHFRNARDEAASMLIGNWPGRVHEAFFSSIGDAMPGNAIPVAPPGPTPDALLSVNRRWSAGCGAELLV